MQVPQHGDATPTNLLGREGDDVLAIDWATLGTGPVGADLGYYALAAREDLEPLLDAYLLGMPDGLATAEEVTLGARVTAVFTVLNRAEWALARAADRRGRAGRQVPAPSGRPAPACAAAAVHPHRGARRGLSRQSAPAANVSQASRVPSW